MSRIQFWRIASKRGHCRSRCLVDWERNLHVHAGSGTLAKLWAYKLLLKIKSHLVLFKIISSSRLSCRLDVLNGFFYPWRKFLKLNLKEFHERQFLKWLDRFSHKTIELHTVSFRILELVLTGVTNTLACLTKRWICVDWKTLKTSWTMDGTLLRITFFSFLLHSSVVQSRYFSTFGNLFL
jgi:hypothetical protein